jgi:DNA-binding MarR family transcriptional regulator
MRVNELARAVVLSPTGMSRFVDRLEAEGLVRREPDPEDRRALQVVLTDAGRDLLRRMWPVYARGIQTHFAAHLPDAPERQRAMFDAMATMEPSAARSSSPSSP